MGEARRYLPPLHAKPPTRFPDEPGKQGGCLGFHGNVRVYSDLGVATVLLGNVTEVSASPIDRRSDEIDPGLLTARIDAATAGASSS